MSKYKEPETVSMSAGKDGEGRPQMREKGTDGVTKVTTFTERNPGHPRGPGVSTSTHYER